MIGKKGGKDLNAEEYFHNDIFRKYWLRMGGDTNQMQVNLVYPATETLINKYSKQEIYSVKETAEVYSKYTKPHFIDKIESSSYEWMLNVLNETKEKELCVFENEHFKLQKDYKFNEGDLSTLYLLAIPKQAPDLKLHSIRDLRKDHLEMLKSIQEESYKAIEQHFGLPKHKVYAYFHYLPTYYLLHVHFVHVDGQAIDKREMQPLEVVIQNIEMFKDYYKKATLNYSIGDKHDLFKIFIQEGVLTEYVPPSDWEDVEKPEHENTSSVAITEETAEGEAEKKIE